MKNKNRTIVKVKGLNQERALNNISKVTTIYNYKKEESNISEFEVDYKNRKTITKLITDQGLEVLSISHNGFISRMLRILTSYGLVASILISILFYLLQYNFVLKVEVWGAEELDQNEIASFVEDNIPSRFKNYIDTEELEIKVKNKFEDVSSVSIAIVGQTLLINLNEAILPDEMEDEFTPLISSYEGLITAIQLVQGTLNVKVGDIVKKGDILVYPYVIDSEGQQRSVSPKAEIIADVWYSSEINHYDYQIITERTGKKEIRTEVLLNNLSIYKNNNPILFEEYECEEYVTSLTKNLVLPFNEKKTIYYETVTVEKIEPFSEVKEKIIEEARKKTLIFLQENEIIKTESWTLKEAGGCHAIEYVITTSKNIGG